VKHDMVPRRLYNQFAFALVFMILDTGHNLVIHIMAMNVGEPKSVIESLFF